MRYELTDRECARKDETPGRDTTYNTMRLTENWEWAWSNWW
jgi:hypothetical protein